MVLPKTYLFFGNVGAGKGTQIFLLKDLLERRDNKRVVYIYPGQVFRTFVEGKGYSNLLAKEILNRGQLLPLFLVSHAFASVALEGLQSPDDDLIIDGFPRSLEQVGVFESAMEFYGRKDIEIVYLKISKEEATKRLKERGRHDDTDQGIIRRFEEYDKNVLPALDSLKSKGYAIHEINGEEHIDNVHLEIKKALGL